MTETSYKLLLVPDDLIIPVGPGEAHLRCDVDPNSHRMPLKTFQIIADVTPDRRLRMPRSIYDTIEVMERR